MSKRILFNFATRSRPQRAKETITNLIGKISDANYVILMKVDTNDPLTSDYLRIFQMCDPYPIKLVIDKSTDKVHAINRDIPTEGWDILVNLSDDIRFTADGFDNIIREHCGPDDFVLFPEPYARAQANRGRNELISVVSIMGFDYYMKDKHVYHPSYKRTHCDNEATALAKIRGNYKQVDKVIFMHEHPSAGYPEFRDAQYLLEKQTWAADAENYRIRKERSFP